MGYAENTFVKSGHRIWKKTKQKLEKHSQSSVHVLHVILAWIQSNRGTWFCCRPAQQGTCKCDTREQKTVAVHCDYCPLCAWQTIALWDHDETCSSEKKEFFWKYYICCHQRTPDYNNNCPHNASNDIQNDLLKAALDIVVDQITQDIQEAEAFSIIADETRDIS